MTVSMRSPEDIVNAALTRIGSPLRVANMQEGSRQSAAALNIYAQERDRVLTEGNYRFARQDVPIAATKTAPALAGTGGHGYVITPWSDTYPPPPWLYEYAWPGDCLKVRSIKPVPNFLPNFTPRPVLFSLTTVFTGFYSGTISFADNPSSGETITLNGVEIEFVPGTPGTNQVQIGANTAFTIAQNLVEVFLGTSTNALLTAATYTTAGGPDAVVLTITYNSPGPSGGNYTLAASDATVSAAALLGSNAANRAILCNSGPNAILTYTSQVTDPNAWDAAFCDEFTAALAEKLPAALSDAKLLQYETSVAQMAAARAAATQD